MQVPKSLHFCFSKTYCEHPRKKAKNLGGIEFAAPAELDSDSESSKSLVLVLFGCCRREVEITFDAIFNIHNHIHFFFFWLCA